MIVIPDYFYRRVALRISRTATAILTPLIRDNCIRGQCRATLRIGAECGFGSLRYRIKHELN